MTIKADTNAVEEAAIPGTVRALVTSDGIDGALLHAAQHEDGDVSIFIGFDTADEQEIVMSREQAKEFFTLAMTLC